MIVGRALDADVPLPFSSVSRRHAALRTGAARVAVIDLGSANGTFIGGRRLAAGVETAWPADAPLRIADVELRFDGAPSSSRAESTGTLARRLAADMAGSERGAALRVIAGPDAGARVVIAERGCRVGRDPACELALHDEDVSREHAAIELRDDGLWLCDRLSKNGVYLNGERVPEERRLRDGDVVKVGGTEIAVEDPAERHVREAAAAADPAPPAAQALVASPDEPGAPAAPPAVPPSLAEISRPVIVRARPSGATAATAAAAVVLLAVVAAMVALLFGGGPR